MSNLKSLPLLTYLAANLNPVFILSAQPIADNFSLSEESIASDISQSTSSAGVGVVHDIVNTEEAGDIIDAGLGLRNKSGDNLKPVVFEGGALMDDDVSKPASPSSVSSNESILANAFSSFINVGIVDSISAASTPAAQNELPQTPLNRHSITPDDISTSIKKRNDEERTNAQEKVRIVSAKGTSLKDLFCPIWSNSSWKDLTKGRDSGGGGEEMKELSIISLLSRTSDLQVSALSSCK
jgi:hypothetical protein